MACAFPPALVFLLKKKKFLLKKKKYKTRWPDPSAPPKLSSPRLSRFASFVKIQHPDPHPFQIQDPEPHILIVRT